MLSNADEARIQAGIAVDTDNPEWTAKDFRRAKPFAKTFPGLVKSRRVRARKRSPPRSLSPCASRAR
jgi:hypothetical protein